MHFRKGPNRPARGPGARPSGPGPGARPSGEEAVVAAIASVLEAATGLAPEGEVWIGDDAAVVAPYSGRVVLATDAAVAGVHADLSLVGLDDLGWKAMASTLSDVGALGARPKHALVSISAPAGTDLERVAVGIGAASQRWRCPVVGGDVTASLEVVVCAAVTGVLEGDAPAVLRSSARAGDRLFVTGPLGGSAAGLRLLRAGHVGDGDGDSVQGALVRAHKRPQARVAEGMLARQAGASAMIDVSDGLAIDVWRLAEASGVGVALTDVPVVPGATEAEALGGGEDYELVITTADPTKLLGEFEAAGLRAPIEIGRCSAEVAERSLQGAPLARTGYLHQFG